MSLLNQFGLKPIQRTGTRGATSDACYFSASLGKGKTYTLSLLPLFKSESIDWDAIDIAFSKPHGGLFIAKGETFKFQKTDRPGRIDSVDIYNTIFGGFCIKKPKAKARVILSYSKFSEDVYLFKVDKIDYNY